MRQPNRASETSFSTNLSFLSNLTDLQQFQTKEFSSTICHKNVEKVLQCDKKHKFWKMMMECRCSEKMEDRLDCQTKKWVWGSCNKESFVQSFISFDLFPNFVINVAKSSKQKYIYKMTLEKFSRVLDLSAGAFCPVHDSKTVMKNYVKIVFS